MAERCVFHVAFLWREQHRLFATCVEIETVEMDPLVGFAEEDDAIVCGEEEPRLARCHVREDAAGFVGLGREDGARGVGGEVEELDGPGVWAGDVRRVLGLAGEGRAEPGDLFAVRREGGSGVVAGGCCGEGELVGGEVIEREKGVRGAAGGRAAGDEGEDVAIGRESKGAGGAAVEDKLVRGGCGRRGRAAFGEPAGFAVGWCERSDPDLAGAEKEETFAVASEERSVAFADDECGSVGGERLHDDLQSGGALEVCWVGGAAVGTALGAVGVGDGGGVG